MRVICKCQKCGACRARRYYHRNRKAILAKKYAKSHPNEPTDEELDARAMRMIQKEGAIS